MSLIQIQVDDKLKQAIKNKAEAYGVPASSIIRIVLVRSFLEKDNTKEGNIFNADRDNKGKGVKIDDLIDKL